MIDLTMILKTNHRLINLDWEFFTMRVKALNNIDLSGDESLASKEDMQQAINKAFVCEYFKVKPNTPTAILKEAIKRTTGENMSFGQFRYRRTK